MRDGATVDVGNTDSGAEAADASIERACVKIGVDVIHCLDRDILPSLDQTVGSARVDIGLGRRIVGCEWRGSASTDDHRYGVAARRIVVGRGNPCDKTQQFGKRIVAVAIGIGWRIATGGVGQIRPLPLRIAIGAEVRIVVAVKTQRVLL